MDAETREWSARKFRLFFDSKIRVGLNWQRLVAEQWPLRTYLLYRLEDLDLTLPWYTAHGREVFFDNPLATPLKLSAIGDWFTQLKGERQRAIDRLWKEYVSSGGQPASLVVPAYRLSIERPGHWMALDSNHRLSALYLAGVPLRITVVVICGSLDPIALPDLRHYVKP